VIGLLNPFRQPSPREMLNRQLEEAMRSKITSAAIAEEHTAHVAMLNTRIARIQNELRAMDTKQGASPQ
jgi:hypothetical protein